MALSELKNTLWYHGRVDRPTCESLLISKRPGSFLVRDSATCLGDYVLSVSENNKVSHYIISRRGPLYLIGDQSFQDLFSVIEFYKKHFLDTTTLTEAIPPPGRSYPSSLPSSAAAPMTGSVHPGVLPPPEQVVGRLIVRGKFEFRSDDPEDLHFNKGDKMVVIRKDEDEWWFAQHEDGRQGAIPVPYVEVVEEQPLKARAVADRDCPYDPTALSFKKGEIIKVLKKNDNGMWEGETSSGKRGHFPFKLVELV